LKPPGWRLPPRVSLLPLVVVFVLATLYCLVIGQITYDTTGFSLLYLLMLIQLTPFVIAYATQRYNFMCFIMGMNFATYSLSKWNQVKFIYHRDSLTDISFETIQYLILCSMLMMFSYYLISKLLAVRWNFGTHKLLVVTKRQLLLLFILAISPHLGNTYIPVPFRSLHLMFTGACLILLLCSELSFDKRLERLALAGVIAASVYGFLKTGSMNSMGLMAGILFVVAFLTKKKMHIYFLVIFIIIMSAFQTVKADYRERTRWRGAGSHIYTLAERSNVLTNLLHLKFFVGYDDENPVSEIEEQRDSLALGFGRIGDDSLERVLAWTPSKVPFWGGETYEFIVYMMIPRFLWRDKPGFNYWNKFGKVYGFISEADNQTSVGISFLGEGYMNFGFLGMFLVALLFGTLVAITEKLSYLILGDHFCFTFIVCIGPFLIPNSSIGPIINSIAITLFSLIISRKYLFRLKEGSTLAQA